jgi:outer membrane protein assembly factor BamB
MSSSSFGQLFATKLLDNGQVYAQPLVVGSTVIAATENDHVYGIDAVTGTIRWSRSLGTPYNITTCANLAPNIGVTGGPVYDPTVTAAAPHGLVYLVAQIVYNGSPRYRLYMLDPVTGAQVGTKFITGSPVNDSSLTFNAAQQLERPGLLLMNGWVYAAFGSHCDHKPYVWATWPG